jgi:hypothetical protein
MAELLDLIRHPAIRLFYMATGFWVSQVLFVATELEVFTLLDSQDFPAEELCQALNLDLRPGRALLAALVSLGLLRFRRGRYSNAPISSEWLVRGKPRYLGEGIAMLRDRLYEPWGRLNRALRTNRPTSFDSSLGELFDYLQEHTDEQVRFVSGMHALNLIPARALAQRLSFRRFRHLADLRGGSGVCAIEAARRFPHLRATVVERAPICRISQEYIKATGLEERIATDCRDFSREPLPPEADVALLSNVLRDFSPEENAALLRHLAEELPDQGVLLLSEWLWREDHTGPLAASLMALNMVVDTRGGRSYTFGELRGLLHAAGFKSVGRRRLFSAVELIVARKT